MTTTDSIKGYDFAALARFLHLARSPLSALPPIRRGSAAGRSRRCCPQAIAAGSCR